MCLGAGFYVCLSAGMHGLGAGFHVCLCAELNVFKCCNACV